MKLYRFSPISDSHEFDQAIAYVAEQVDALSQKLTGQSHPIASLKIFAHYPEEYLVIKQIALGYGAQKSQSETSLYIQTTRNLADRDVHVLGVRIADPYRFQVGCGDIIVSDWRSLSDTRLDAANCFVRDMPGREDQFIELWHPDFDVAAYISKK